MAFCPGVAALILVWREEGGDGATHLLKRAFDCRRIKAKVWYAPILLLPLLGMVLGAVWAVWQVVPLLQAHRPAVWIAAWSLSTVASRVIIVWLYNNTGRSVFAAALYHAMSNVAWPLFPSYGSHYDPRFVAPILGIAAATVTVAWGPRTLARPPRAHTREP